MRLYIILGLTLAIICLVTGALADVPRVINYQGRLADDAGKPLDTTVAITFTIYDDSTAEDALWTETHPAVAVKEGLFNVLLGSVGRGSLDEALFDEAGRYLGITVGTDLEIRPRTEIASVAYAFQSLNSASGGGWTDDGPTIRLSDGGDNVGIGTTSPNARLEVSSVMRLTPMDIPGVCSQNLKGSLLYNGYMNELCYCNGIKWMQVDGGGSCACDDDDQDGFDICDPDNPADTDGQPADCDDLNASVNPSGIETGHDPESCMDGLDNDCDGLIDCDDPDCCTDYDSDGYGTDHELDCCPSPGHDCDDGNPQINPGMPEICDDGIDNDCDEETDCTDPDCWCNDMDGDGYGNPPGPCCSYPQTDCDDENTLVNPGQTETPGDGNCSDGYDNDCDGLPDCYDPSCACCPDDDGDGYDTCNPGDPGDTDGLPADCDDQHGAVNPGTPESDAAGNCSDGLDNDCDGQTDCDDRDCSCR